MRWGIVGFGWVARDHMLPALRGLGHEVVGIVDPAPDAHAVAHARGLATLDLDQLIALRPDAVYVATPNHRHLGPVAALSATGLPVLCEKPLAATLADAEALATAVAGTRYGTAFDQRHHPAHRVAAQAIEAGAIGRVTAVRIVYCCWVDPLWSPTGATNWRADPAAAGGGAVIDLALHGLDLAQLLVGEPLTALHITLQRRIHDYPVDDGGLLAGRFAGGALFQAHVAYNCPEDLPRRRLEIVGEHGQLTALDTMGQSAGGTLTLSIGGTTSPIAFDASLAPFAAQAEAFAAYARSGAGDFSIGRDIALMRLFDPAYRQAQSCL